MLTYLNTSFSYMLNNHHSLTIKLKLLCRLGIFKFPTYLNPKFQLFSLNNQQPLAGIALGAFGSVLVFGLILEDDDVPIFAIGRGILVYSTIEPS